MKKSKKIIGIDLGTTNSCVSIMEGKEPKVITNAEGIRTTPSVVAFKGKERLIGTTAKRQAVTNPENTISSAKRFIGRTMSEVSEEIKTVPYKVEAHSNGKVGIRVGDRVISPEEIGSHVLSKMRETAERYLGESITEAVVTVPAYFNDSQRQSTKDAGRIAGLNIKRIINEPTAAALAYGLDKKAKDQKIVVFDLGGGTFDVSILDIGDSVFEVLSTNGDTHLGGDNFDEAIIKWMIAEFKAKEGIDLSKDKIALQRIRDAAEKAKIDLSVMSTTEINEPFITMTQDGPKHLNFSLTRAKLENLVGDLVAKTVAPCRKAMEDAGISKEEMHTVLLVGGMTRMPAVQKKVKEIFGKEPSQGVNPDEVVAMGAAIQAGVLTGEVKDLLLLDVVPLSLGIETVGGVCTKLIERNSNIPLKTTQTFSTAADGQEAVTIVVLQGERETSSGNKKIAEFNLTGIPPAPRGVPQIEVTFDITVEGILKVSARDKSSGKEQNITVDSASSLTEDEIQKAIKEHEAHAEEDKKFVELANLKNESDSLISRVEKSLKDHGSKVPEDIKKDIEAKINECKESLKSGNMDTIKATKEALQNASHKIGEFLSKSAETSSTTTPDPKKGKENIEDAEVEVVEDENKKKE